MPKPKTPRSRLRSKHCSMPERSGREVIIGEDGSLQLSRLPVALVCRKADEKAPRNVLCARDETKRSVPSVRSFDMIPIH